MENVMQVRVTGILIEDEKVLLVKQRVANRNWSLPGGRVENGETLEELSRYGFSEKFIKLASEKFLNAGSYQGLKQNIGL
ncbi:NUDIX hydrolase [Bacillus mycoides]|uniref:NUDIX hydrolase n=1 Tax=Bacillus mycoides TaxID=1405 RepID=UPI00187AA99A|nr:NUDIX domain-containing protein [Bacillus mycoides]MBE7125919.1 NUDIX domain-containing protein [Bacillus mycoides]